MNPKGMGWNVIFFFFSFLRWASCSVVDMEMARLDRRLPGFYFLFLLSRPLHAFLIPRPSGEYIAGGVLWASYFYEVDF